MLRYVAVFALVAVTLAQEFDYVPAPRPAPPRVKAGYSGPTSSPARQPPIAIIKQIDRHNEDGSYTYGYESADGSFKIETKLPTGEVKGKYGYVDDTGKVRVIEYGATKHGFAPTGEGITVPPPTLVDETTDNQGALLPEYSGAYDQQDNEPQQESSRSQQPYTRPISSSVFDFSSNAAPRPAPRPALRPEPLEYSPPQTFEPAPRPAPRPQSPSSASYSFDFPSRPAFSGAPAPSKSPSFSPAPAPPRPAAFANAAPAPPRPAAFANAAPAPSNDFGGFQAASIPARPAPQPAFSRPPPAPQYRPAPAPQYRPAPQPQGRQSGGSILDQLSKDYALPQSNSAPLHDISFGYY